MTKIVTVMKRKGGVGASSIAGNLAGEFAAKGREVVLLDCDPQGSCVTWAGLGSGILTNLVKEAATDSPREFHRFLQEARAAADVVVIDTPPSFPVTALEAAKAADLIVIPCSPSMLDIECAEDALEVAQTCTGSDGQPPLIRFVPSRNLPRTKLGRELPAALEEIGAPCLPAINARVAIAESVLEGLTVREWDEESPAKEEFSALCDAISALVGLEVASNG